MEPPMGAMAPKYVDSAFFSLEPDNVVEISGPLPRTLQNLVEFAEPCPPPEDQQEKRSENTMIKRCPASLDLSSTVEKTRNESFRESKSVDTILQLLRANSYVKAIEIYHALTIRHFKNTAFKVIANKLFESQQISIYISELIKDLAIDKRDEKIFEIASEHIEISRNLIKAKQEKIQVVTEEDFKSAFHETSPLANTVIHNIVGLYKVINNDSLRCALLMRMNASIFIFREIPVPRFPIDAIRKMGIPNRKDLEEARKNFQISLTPLIQACRAFMDEKTINAKTHIEKDLLSFHIEAGEVASLDFFFKNTCEPKHIVCLLPIALDELIQKGRINLLPLIMQMIIEMRDRFAVNDRPHIEEKIASAVIFAYGKGEIALAEKYAQLIPAKNDEILKRISRS